MLIKYDKADVLKEKNDFGVGKVEEIKMLVIQSYDCESAALAYADLSLDHDKQPAHYVVDAKDVINSGDEDVIEECCDDHHYKFTFGEHAQFDVYCLEKMDLSLTIPSHQNTEITVYFDSEKVTDCSIFDECIISIILLCSYSFLQSDVNSC